MKKNVRIVIVLLAVFVCTPFAHGTPDKTDLPLLQPETVSALADNATHITVRANVRKAAVYLNGTFEGVSPATLRNLVQGQYHLRVEKTGYEPQEYLLFVERGTAQTFFIPLKKTADKSTEQETEPSKADDA